MTDSSVYRPCIICSTEALVKHSFVSHLLGKKHRKKANTRKIMGASVHDQILHIIGFSDFRHEAPRVIEEFWRYGVVDAMFYKKFGFIEFETKEATKRALKDDHVIKGTKLNVYPHESPVLKEKRGKESEDYKEGKKLPPISDELRKKLKTAVEGPAIDDLIVNLMREIELKPRDYQEREKIRFIMENFLRPTFPHIRAFVFGSSANNLGFLGCDVDMVVDLGFDVWEEENKAKAERRAADLTFFLAKEIRNRRRGYNVVPISRARVPIVKFTDCLNGLEVDLSFKNGMPIHNTALIKLYTRIHPVVKPYLMLLRYWAKVQNVAGGGQPSILLTNYCFCMMMLFWLMIRQRPIVPCVGELQEAYTRNSERPVYIDGWNCSFSEDVKKWGILYHETTILDLAIEFFEFYSQLDSKEWVISPLAGSLVKKKDILAHTPSSKQRYLEDFYHYKLPLPVKKPLCVQDPFEQCYNIARGLKEEPLALFQVKCQKAADICKEIKGGEVSLGTLFDDTRIEKEELLNYLNLSTTSVIDEVDGEVLSECSDDSIELLQELECLERNGGFEMLKAVNSGGKRVTKAFAPSKSSEDMNEEGSAKNDSSYKDEEEEIEITIVKEKKGKSTLEVIELDEVAVKDSSEEVIILKEVSAEADTSQDEIVVLDESQKEDSDLEVDSELLERTCKNEGMKRTVIFADIEENLPNHTWLNDSKNVRPLDNGARFKGPLGEKYSFKFEFKANFLFEVLSDGGLRINSTEMVNDSCKDNCIKDFWIFILKQCLKCDVLEVQTPLEVPEKSEVIQSDGLNAKRKSHESHEQFPSKYLKANDGEGKATESDYIFISKHKSRTRWKIWEGRRKMAKQLHTLSLSPIQYELALSNLIKSCQNGKEFSLEFESSLWKETKNPSSFWITGKFDSLNNKLQNMFCNFFSFSAKLTSNLASKTDALISCSR